MLLVSPLDRNYSRRNLDKVFAIETGMCTTCFLFVCLFALFVVWPFLIGERAMRYLTAVCGHSLPRSI